MDIRKIDDRLAVSPQIEPTDLPQIAAAGFRTIICNRPDGEGPDQPAFDAIDKAARENGIAAVYLPVISGQMTDEDAMAFGKAMDETDTPVLAYCRTGTRCTALWSLDQGRRGRALDEVVGAARDAGYDMSGLAPRIAAMGGLG